MDPISTALVAAAVKEAAGPAAKFVKSFGIESFKSMVSKFQNSFQGHVESTRLRCSKMKNILYRDQSVDFLSQYVNVEFSASRTETISDVQAVADVISGKRLLICGTAGAGKTMFMRWSALNLIDGMKQNGRVPIFLEMRYFEDDYAKLALEKYVYDKTSAKSDAADYEQFVKGLKAGLFIILLDAIDEINPRFRDKVIAKIMDFMREYPECGLIISSRYDEKLESIQDFSVFRTRPMEHDQVIKVIERLEYDEHVKEKLIEKLNGGLYQELDEFLSNPLLVTIMLLTFDHSADIPTKLTSFYQQAFEALYQRHDAAKGAYKRAHYAELPIDRYQTVFATFSFQTYLVYKFEFSDADLALAFREACAYAQEEADPSLLIKDSMESVCLIQREGLDNVFSHRSFQEYFCALFISKYREADVGNLIEAVATMENRSNVLKMLYELAPEVVEYEWVLPILAKYLEQFGRAKLTTKTGLQRVFSASFGSFEINKSTNKVELISWPSPFRSVKDGLAGRWMSIIQSATQRRLEFYNRLFNEPLWDDFDTFFNSLPVDVRPSADWMRDRLKTPSEGTGGTMLTVFPSDSPWLIHSELPERFERMRAAIRKYHDDILERRNARKASVKGLLMKPKERRPRTKARG